MHETMKVLSLLQLHNHEWNLILLDLLRAILDKADNVMTIDFCKSVGFCFDLV